MIGLSIQLPKPPRKWSRPYLVVKPVRGSDFEFEIGVLPPHKVSYVHGSVPFESIEATVAILKSGKDYLLGEWLDAKRKKK